MLVYANHLRFEGVDAETAVFKGIGGWLKEQLGFGLHPDQLKTDGEFNGTRGDVRSWLRVLATTEEEPRLYSWVLKFPDDAVRGRQWIAEVGVKSIGRRVDVSCVVKTDEHCTLVLSPVSASQPRLIRYVVNNVQRAKDADFRLPLPGVEIKSVGEDKHSYVAFLAEVERKDREGPIVLVSPTKDGDYLVNVNELQERLVGLAQVVQVTRGFNSYEMSEVLGEQWSVWGGAVNILSPPTEAGQVRGRYFLADVIAGWGATQNQRISQVLALVTNITNIPRMRGHIRPEGVMQLSLRRRMETARAKSDKMDASQLRAELDEAAKQSAEQAKYFNELVEENSQLEATASGLKSDLEDAQGELATKDFTIQALKEQLLRAGVGRTNFGSEELIPELLDLICRVEPPSPLECLGVIEKVYGEECIILASGRNSAEKMTRFIQGRQLLTLLKRLVTEYRSKLMEGGDIKARTVFGRGDYAAKESETVMKSKVMRRKRTFEYEGELVEMFRHLKIGVDDDESKTIRVHFHWDAEREKIVIGYCGAHLPVASR